MDLTAKLQRGKRELEGRAIEVIQSEQHRKMSKKKINRASEPST